MHKLLINQTDSERRMHRILYFLKYLRAMILNVVLVILATLGYFFFGFCCIHPLANDTIKVLQAMEASNQQNGFVVTVSILASVFVMLFSLWVYISITRVWRKSLRVQLIFLFVCLVFFPFFAWNEIAFSIKNLDALFTLFSIFYYLLCIWMVFDVSIGLWKASNASEISSFSATLDPRLTQGLCGYINKLLDLPRTPFQTWRNFCAYLLALGGSILFIVSFVYLISLGGVTNKLSQLSVTCTPENMAECSRQSSIWAKQILFWLLPSFLGVKLALLLQSTARKLGGLSVTDAVRGYKKRYILYLRPFAVDSIVLPKPQFPFLSKMLAIRPFSSKIEEEFFDVADGYRALIAIGKPGQDNKLVGGLAHKEYLSNEDWQAYVLDKIQGAESVVVVLNNTSGVLWEISSVLEHKALSKTLFLFDPIAKNIKAWESLVQDILPHFIRAEAINSDFNFDDHLIGFYFRDNDIIQIKNANWTATSYRTAFSYFLSERQQLSEKILTNLAL